MRAGWLNANVGWLLAGRALRSFSQSILVITAPLYVAAAGFRAGEIGLLLSAAMAGSVALTLTVGFLSDRFGRRLLLAVISALGGIGAFVYPLTTRFWILAAMSSFDSMRGGGAGSGGGFGPFYPAEQPLIAASASDRDRSSVFSALSLVGVLAGTLGSLTAGLPHLLMGSFRLGALESFTLVFWIAAASSFLGCFAVFPIQERPRARPPSVAPLPVLPARGLIARLWLTNAINGVAIGVLGPFLTYWFSVRYHAGAGSIALLYTSANALTTLSYVVAPSAARRLGTVKAIVSSRLGAVVLMAGMALAPSFVWAALAYGVRVMINSISMPLRQSYVVGVSEEERRSEIAAIGSLPAQVTGLAAPTLAAHLLKVSTTAPIWVAAAAMAINATLWAFLFRKLKPPEEQR
jgi:MFS family permease